jgi:hypothetical protein
MLWGVIPASGYIVLASFVAATEFNCDGGFLDFCGIGTHMITYPSQLVFGEFLSERGLKIYFHHSPDSSDIALLMLHIGFCALLVFLAGYSSRWVINFVRWLLEGKRETPS